LANLDRGYQQPALRQSANAFRCFKRSLKITSINFIAFVHRVG